MWMVHDAGRSGMPGREPALCLGMSKSAPSKPRQRASFQGVQAKFPKDYILPAGMKGNRQRGFAPAMGGVELGWY